jgi:hypothetical protein
MPTPVTEAVRKAKEALGDVPPEDLAVYIAANFGMTVKPVIVSITLASFARFELGCTNRPPVIPAPPTLSPCIRDGPSRNRRGFGL